MFGVLDLQSAYSMLKNTIPLEKLIESAKSSGYDFIALSDEHLYGMMSLFREAKKHGIKPVLGLKLHVTTGLEESGFLVFVKNQTGYQHLLKLNMLKSERSLTLEDLSLYQEGLFFVTSGMDSAIDTYIRSEDYDMAKKIAIEYEKSILDLYLGLSLDTFDAEMKVAPIMRQISEQTGIQMLPLHRTSYLLPIDKEAYEALIKIDHDQNEMPKDANFAFMNRVEIEHLFMDYPYVFDTLSTVISQVNFEWKTPIFEMPHYEVPQGDVGVYLKSLATVGLQKRLKKTQDANVSVYQERLNFELSVIHQMGFDAYFLIVYDFVKYAKTHDILVGPGRGSSAGSLVAYCLGITDVDPIEYGLLFERFLNPARITMPDIDMDFPDNKRDEVLAYVRKKYGEFHVVSIVTFGTFALRSSIRDIARVMKIDTSRVNGIIQAVINEKVDPTDHETERLLRVAKSIEGLPRHTGTHAAGMILAHQDLSTYIPLTKGINDFYQSQLEASELEQMGLLKMDFLGIRNLAVIDDVVKAIHRFNKPFSLVSIPLDDANTFKILEHADTNGIFQLESMGMRNALRKLKPRTFEDIVAINALFRPGPMDNIDEFIKRRNGKTFTYLHPNLKPILESTYGIIVYQEQVMRIASEFAGYTLAEADLLRRAISKKDKHTLEIERERFKVKCQSKQYPESLAIEIYDYIVKFADYGFNRSHSVAYALIAYQMAYLKANYFGVFMTILLSSVTGNEGLTAEYLQEIRKKNIPILAPDINLSTDSYAYDSEGIRLPLLSIKSIGRQTVIRIMDERKLNGPFIDYQNFKYRMKKDVNDKNLEMLIHSGALDGFGLNHQTMIYHKHMDSAGYEQYITDFKLKTTEDYAFILKAQYEKEALGFNLNYHPLRAYSEIIQKERLKPLAELEASQEIEALAFIIKKREIKTKSGQLMAFVVLDDGTTQIEATLFTETYQKYTQWLESEVLIFKLKTNTYKGQTSYVIEGIRKVNTTP
jgi:DNA polymerase III subunit alpha